jgi:hypothetical protein
MYVKVISIKRLLVDDDFITLLIKHVPEEGFLQVMLLWLVFYEKEGCGGDI